MHETRSGDARSRTRIAAVDAYWPHAENVSGIESDRRENAPGDLNRRAEHVQKSP